MSYLTQRRNDVVATYDGAVAVDASLLTPIYQPTPVSSAVISPLSGTALVGDTLQFSVSISPDNAVDKTGVWASSNSAIATVDSSGLATFIASGSVTISWIANSNPAATASAAIIVAATDPTAPVTASVDSWDFGGGTQSLTGLINGKTLTLPSNAAYQPTFGDSYIQMYAASQTQSAGIYLADMTLDITSPGQTLWCVLEAPEASQGRMFFGSAGAYGLDKPSTLSYIGYVTPGVSLPHSAGQIRPADGNTWAAGDILFFALAIDSTGVNSYDSVMGALTVSGTVTPLTQTVNVGFGPLNGASYGNYMVGPKLFAAGVENRKLTADELVKKYNEVKAHLAARSVPVMVR